MSWLKEQIEQTKEELRAKAEAANSGIALLSLGDEEAPAVPEPAKPETIWHNSETRDMVGVKIYISSGADARFFADKELTTPVDCKYLLTLPEYVPIYLYGNDGEMLFSFMRLDLAAKIKCEDGVSAMYSGVGPKGITALLISEAFGQYDIKLVNPDSGM